MIVRLFVPLACVVGTFALGGFVGRVARERGRSAAAWMTLATIVAVVAATLGFWSFGLSLFGGDAADVSIGRAFVGPLAVALGPLLAVATVVLAVWKLPERVPTIGGARWTVYRLSSPDEAAGECVLAVDGGALHVGDWCIAPGELKEVVADGECLRVSTDARSRALMPVGRNLSAKEKSKRSAALARRLRALLR